MAYSHYQHAPPAWGANQYQFAPPPTPTFQPQPSWRGMDFYRAHAPTQDPSLFDHAWGRVRDHTGIGADPQGPGVSTNEAIHWHNRAYGLGELNRMLPVNIGHAAAYEAYRHWTQNTSMYEPSDVSREREHLIGSAVGEAARLISFIGLQPDQYARLTASESAAATASNIFYESREVGDGYRGRSRSRTRFGSSGSSYGDPYAYDDTSSTGHHSRHHHRSHSRPRSRSRSRPPPMLSLGTAPPAPYIPGYPSSVPPGVAAGYSDHSPNHGSFPGTHSMPINMPNHGTPYPHSAVSMESFPSHSSQPYQTHIAQPYQTHITQPYQPHTAQPYQTQIYQQQPYPPHPGVHLSAASHASHHRGRSMSTSYAEGNPYAGAPGNATVNTQPPPQIIYIKGSSSSRKHRHHHHSRDHSRHRHRSSSRNPRHSTRDISPYPYEDHYPDNYRRQM